LASSIVDKWKTAGKLVLPEILNLNIFAYKYKLKRGGQLKVHGNSLPPLQVLAKPGLLVWRQITNRREMIEKPFRVYNKRVDRGFF